MRLAAIEDVLEVAPREGRFLEVGAGNGDITSWLSETRRGWAYDIGDDTRAHLRTSLDPQRVSVIDALSEIDGTVDLLLAFEVLEHIEDDLGALQEWTEHLETGGYFVMSVPAHQRKFGPADEAVGHVRRYEKAALTALVEAAGFTVERVVNYGFPLGNVTRGLQGIVGRLRPNDLATGDALERSIRSGVERDTTLNWAAPLVNGTTLAPATWLQRRFYDQDLGDGYVLLARKR